MTTENPAEGNPLPGDGVVPTAPLQMGNAQPLQGDVASLKKRLDDLDARTRSLQGEKDKRWDKEVMPVIKKLAQYLNLTDEQVIAAQRNLALDQLVESNMLTQQTQNPVAQVSAAKVDVQSVISEYGLDPNDPEVLKTLLTENPTVSLGKLAIARAKTNQLPPQAPPAEGQPVTPDGVAELRAKYQKEVALWRGNIQKVSEIQAKYRKLGLPI